MRWLSVAVLAAVVACGASVDMGPAPEPKSEVVGDWSDGEGHRVITVFTRSTDREDIGRFARRFPNPNGDTIRMEFFNDRAKTPALTSSATKEEVAALCTETSLEPVRVASYDGATGTIAFGAVEP